jgi:uncharacterized OB-fold protein
MSLNPAKPLPKPTAESLPFWQGCADGRLLYQRCTACDRAQFPPRSRCAYCFNERLVWRESARVGAVHTFTEVHRAPTAAFKADVPYVIALVDLDEGFRMMMNLHAPDRSAIAIGSRVRVNFEDTGGAWPLPQGELLGPTLTFEGFEVGKLYGRSTETLDQPLLDRWCALYPWDRPEPGTVPSGIATVLTMRAYMLALQPRPPGNVHASSAMKILAPLRLGARITTEIRCVGKELKKERRFVDVESRSIDETDVEVATATMRLMWAI